MSTMESHYSASDIEARILAGLREAGLDPEQRLSPAELGALDHFHTGGIAASRELLELAKIQAEHRVLDIGAGLAGCARMLAHEVGCPVDCIEMSSDYCVGAELLNRLTGLEDQITIKQGSALELPYPDASFDVVWMQNVGMNIADKQTLYTEIARVLKPGGCFAFQEVAAGKEALDYFPVPWATHPDDNHLLSADEFDAILSGLGFTSELFEDVSESTYATNVANSTPTTGGDLGLSVYVDNLAEKGGNVRRSLDENRIRYVRGVFILN